MRVVPDWQTTRERDLRPTTARKEKNPANNQMSLKEDLQFGCSLVDALITTLWDLAQRTPLDHTQTREPRKLLDNKCI